MTLRSAAIYGLLMPILIFTMGASAPNISALSQEYKSVPSFPNERIYEGLMNNILFDEVMANPNTIELFRKENAQTDNVEQAILRKQFLLAEIYKQAFVEIQGDGSAEKFLLLFFGGQIPGANSSSLPAIDRLTSSRALHGVIAGLVKRENSVAFLALDILKLEGPRYPSTDSFARGLARFAAESAVNPVLFDQVLTTFDRLYELQKLKPKPDGAPSFERYHIGSIATEISNTTYNPALKDARLKTAIVSAMLSQIEKRLVKTNGEAGSETRADLIRGLGPIADDRRIDQFLTSLLTKSNDATDLKAAFMAVMLRPQNRALLRILKSQISRYAALTQNSKENAAMIKSAVETITNPFWNHRLEEASAGRPLMLRLFADPSAFVRQHSIPALESKAFTDQEAERFIRFFMNDANEDVRMRAIDKLWSATTRFDTTSFDNDLVRISQRDPSEAVRKMAIETRDHIREKSAKRCQYMFRSAD